MQKISESTLLPLSMICGLLGITAAGAWFIARIDLAVFNNARAAEAVAQQVAEIQAARTLSRDEYLNFVRHIDGRLIGIELKLGIKPYKGDK